MRISRWIMVALFLVSAVLVVEAQQPRQGGGFGQVNTTNAVLSNKDLQEELKVTDAQKEMFKGAVEKQTEANKKRGEAFKGAGGDKDKLKELVADMQKDTEKLNQEIKKVVEETLTSDQKKRLAQIDLQVKGMRAFSDEKIAKDLSITDGQASKIKGVMEEYTKDSKELGFGGGGGKGGFDKEKTAENQKKREKTRRPQWPTSMRHSRPSRRRSGRKWSALRSTPRSSARASAAEVSAATRTRPRINFEPHPTK